MSLRKVIKLIAQEAYENIADAPYWGDRAAGVLLIAEDTGRLLAALRSQDVNEPGTWGTIGGKVDEDEDFEDAALRELREEAGYSGSVKLIPAYKFADEDVFEYQNFIGIVPNEVTLDTSWETDAFEWLSLDELEGLEPKHVGLELLLVNSADLIEKYTETSQLEFGI